MSKKRSIPEQDLLNRMFSVRPEEVEGLNNTSVVYYTNECIKKLFGVYSIEKVPDGWDIDYMKERIFLDGMLCITDTAAGVLPLQTGVSGFNVFNHPTTCVIANPVLGSFERTIDKDCALVKLQFNYGNVWPIINRYAALLASCDSAIAVNLINTKATAIFGAETKAEAESYKKMYDQMTEGKPAVFIGENIAKKLTERLLFNRVKESYIAADVEDLKQRLMDDFLSDIGINNANTDKRERLNTYEVVSNTQEVRSGAEHWLQNVNDGFKRANELYGLSLRMIRHEWKPDAGKEVPENEPTESA
ncbi:MAG: hypothetical protein J6B91_04690 [Prevotella sp.]|nr:hypothetical protein [Prevotella sp.]